MSYALRCLSGAALLGSLFLAAGCQRMPAGPSLADLVITNLSWRSTTGDANLCCCRVTGRATNNNTVAVHVSIKFAGYADPQASAVATTVYFINNLEPSASHTIDAAGFVVPCSAISSLKYEVEVKGLTAPPQ